MAEREKEFSLADFFSLLTTRRELIIGCMVLLGVFLTFVALAGAPVYEANGSFQITSQGGALGALSELISFSGGSSSLNSEIEIVRSRSIALSVIDDLDLQVKITDTTHGGPLTKATMFVLSDRLQRQLRDIRIVDAEFPSGSIDTAFTLTFTDDSGNYRISGPSGDLGTGHQGDPFVSDQLSLTVASMKGPAGTEFELKPRGLYDTLRTYREMLRVSALGGSTRTNLIQLQYKDTNPGLARDVVNAVIDEYDRRNTEWKEGLGSSQTALIEDRLNEVLGELTDAEEALAEYKNQFGVVSMPQEASLAVSELSAREAEKIDLDLRVSLLQGVHSRLASSLNDDSFAVPPSLTGDPLIAQLAADHARLTVELDDLLLDYTESHPSVIAKRESILNVRENILGAISSTTRGLIGQRSDLGGIISGLEQNMYSIPGVERDLLELERERDVSEAAYRLLAQRLDEARLITASYSVGNRIIDRAVAPDRQIYPSIKKNLAMGLGLGLVLGIFLAFLLEMTDPRIRRADQLLDLLNGSPVTKVVKATDEEIARAAGTLALSTLRSGMKSLSLVCPGPDTPRLRGQLEKIIKELSRGVYPILLVDTATNGKILTFFDVDESIGIAEIAHGKDVEPQEVEGKRILVLPPGSDPSSSYVTNQLVRDKVRSLQTQTSLTLFHLPGFSRLPAQRGWNTMAGGAVLVIQRNREYKVDYYRAIDALEADNTPILAALLLD